MGLEPVVATQCVAIEPDWRPVKQAPRHMHPDIAAKVEAEVDKLVRLDSSGKYNAQSS